MLDVQIYEMDYSVSPGGVNCWEMTVGNKCYSEFKTAGQALDHLLNMYPDLEFNLEVLSLGAYEVANA